MTSGPLVRARERYLAEFRTQTIAPMFFLESALRNEDGAVAVEGVLRLPLRVDLIDKSTGETKLVNTPGPFAEEKESLLIQGVAITITNPHWDDLLVRLDGCIPTNFSALRAWFSAWFDMDDRNQLNAEGFYGVVHFLGDPETTNGDTYLHVDLGSAPLEAFDRLLECLLVFRPTHIGISANYLSRGLDAKPSQ